jgi:hypothetical protein
MIFRKEKFFMKIKIISLCCFLGMSFSYATEDTETNTTQNGESNSTVVVNKEKNIECTIF